MDSLVPEGHQGLGPRSFHTGQQLLLILHLANPPPAAAGNGLDHERIAVGSREIQGLPRPRGPRGKAGGGGDHRDASLLGGLSGEHLAPQAADHLRGWPDEHQTSVDAGYGEVGILRQKAIARVDCLGPGLSGRLDNLADIQVIFPGAGADTHRLIGPHDMVGVLVGLLIDDHHLEAQLLSGAHDAQGDLPPIGDQNLVNLPPGRHEDSPAAPPWGWPGWQPVLKPFPSGSNPDSRVVSLAFRRLWMRNISCRAVKNTWGLSLPPIFSRLLAAVS